MTRLPAEFPAGVTLIFINFSCLFCSTKFGSFTACLKSLILDEQDQRGGNVRQTSFFRTLSFYLSRDFRTPFLCNLSVSSYAMLTSTLKMEAIAFSENLIFTYKAAPCYDREQKNLAETVKSLAIFRRIPVRICTGNPTILIEVFRRFFLSLQANAGIVPQIGHDCFHPHTFTRDPSIRCCRTRVAKLTDNRSRI
jgi:hypothetical protein